MNSDDRIQRLEQQVQELQETVARLVQSHRPEPLPPRPLKPITPAPENAPPAAKEVYKADVRRNVDKVLGGEAGDTWETRIAGIWLSRIAAIVLMTAVILGARVTMYESYLGPAGKVLILYIGSLLAVAYGLHASKRWGMFPLTILGVGLAGLYFATYGLFFVDGLRLVNAPHLAAPVLLGCLIALVVFIHLKRSQIVAGITMFLVYYTIVASCMHGKTAENIVYALATLAALAVAGVLFHAMHRWLIFSWGSIVAVYATYLYYFLKKPTGLEMSDLDYFWVSNGFLAICYLLFSFSCIFDARKTGEYRRVVAPISGFNSGIFFSLTWMAIRTHYPHYEWRFRLAFAAGLLILALTAELSGPRRNYLYQVFVAKAIIMFTLALQAYMSGEKLMVAISIECLALALSYRRSGVVVFKILGLGMLLVSFVGCLLHVHAPGETWIIFGRVPTNWFCVVGASASFIATAWLFERHVRRVPPQDRVVTGQWFLADTVLDLYPGTVALLHAAAASLLLLCITIWDMDSNPLKPYVLAGEGVLMVVLGLLLRTPPVQIGGVLLLVASHVCYYVFLSVGEPGLTTQPNYVVYTLLVAMFTYAGAYFWERYLRRAQQGQPVQHHIVAALPYLAATLMLTTLIGQQIEGIDKAISQNALGVALLMAGALAGLPGVKASGVLAFIIGTCAHYGSLFGSSRVYTDVPGFFWYVLIFLGLYVIGERLFVVLERQEKAPSPSEDKVRVVFIAVCAVMGMISFERIADPAYLTLYWLGLGVAGAVLGAIFGEVRYRWAAILLFAASIVRAFAYDLRKLPPIYAFISFAALALALMIVAWAYGRYRQRRLQAFQAAQTQQELKQADG